VAIDPITKLVAGKRTEEQTRRLLQESKDPLAPGCLPALFSDATKLIPWLFWQLLGIVTRCPAVAVRDSGQNPGCVAPEAWSMPR
jgi:hypothetical protein